MSWIKLYLTKLETKLSHQKNNNLPTHFLYKIFMLKLFDQIHGSKVKRKKIQEMEKKNVHMEWNGKINKHLQSNQHIKMTSAMWVAAERTRPSASGADPGRLWASGRLLQAGGRTARLAGSRRGGSEHAGPGGLRGGRHQAAAPGLQGQTCFISLCCFCCSFCICHFPHKTTPTSPARLKIQAPLEKCHFCAHEAASHCFDLLSPFNFVSQKQNDFFGIFGIEASACPNTCKVYVYWLCPNTSSPKRTQ